MMWKISIRVCSVILVNSVDYEDLFRTNLNILEIFNRSFVILFQHIFVIPKTL